MEAFRELLRRASFKGRDDLIYFARFGRIVVPINMRVTWNERLKNNNLLQQQLPKTMRNLKEEIMLQYTYPRLDINVSVCINHLLKAPFCVHPKTGKICVPISVKTIDKFDPDNVPTIRYVKHTPRKL